MKRLSLFATIALVVLVCGSVASAQTTTPKPPPTYEQVIVNTWKNLHNKILTMAKDTQFPDDKLGWKPHPGFAQHARGVASRHDRPRDDDGGGQGREVRLRGAREDGREQAEDARQHGGGNGSGDCRVVSRSSKAASRSPQLIGWLDHQGEHYGKLVTAYRVNGIVPPISRPKS